MHVMILNSFKKYIENCKTKNLFLLEFGPGISTELFSQNFKKVISYENDKEYMKELKKFDNVEYVHVDVISKYWKEIKNNIKKADYIFIDNNPKFVKRETVLWYCIKYAKENCKIILDNGLWNNKGQKYLQSKYFCKDFYGLRNDNVFTNTIVGEMKIPEYYKK